MPSFSDHLARLERLGKLKPGAAVIVPQSGRTGVLRDKGARNQGWLIEWDEPMFGVTESRIVPSILEPRS